MYSLANVHKADARLHRVARRHVNRSNLDLRATKLHLKQDRAAAVLRAGDHDGCCESDAALIMIAEPRRTTWTARSRSASKRQLGEACVWPLRSEPPVHIWWRRAARGRCRGRRLPCGQDCGRRRRSTSRAPACTRRGVNDDDRSSLGWGRRRCRRPLRAKIGRRRRRCWARRSASGGSPWGAPIRRTLIKRKNEFETENSSTWFYYGCQRRVSLHIV